MTHDQAVTLLDTAYRQGMREIFVQADLFEAYQQGLKTLGWLGGPKPLRSDPPMLMFRDAQVKLMAPNRMH